MMEIHVKVEFIEKLLGTASANPELHSDYIASKAPDAPSRAEEVAAIGADAVEEKGRTVFPRLEDGTPFLWDYQVKGFFKEACKVCREMDGGKSKALKVYKQKIDNLLFVYGRRIPLKLPEGGEVGDLQRSLRAQTPQGERVCLASSDVAPEGTTAEFDVKLLRDDMLPYVLEWLDYGELKGMGQWRNSGCGRFMYQYEVTGDADVE